MKNNKLLKRVATLILSGVLIFPSVFETVSFRAKAADPKEKPAIMESKAQMNYNTILNQAVDFGVIANVFTQNEHMETTMAVNKFVNNRTVGGEVRNNDVDFIQNGSTAHFLIGEITTQMRLSKNTAGTFKFDLSPSLYNEFSNHNYTPSSNQTSHFKLDTAFFASSPQIVVNEKSNVSQWMSDFMDRIKTESDNISAKAKNSDYYLKYKQYATFTSSNQVVIDLSDDEFEDKVVYIDVDSDLKRCMAASSGITIKKNSSTVVIFNYSGSDGSVKGTSDSVTIEKIVVKVKQPSGSYKTITSSTYWSGNEGSGNQTITNVDKEICQKVIWNLRTQGKVTISGSAGVFLAPYSKKVVFSQNGGGSAGWVVADEAKNEAEWHYIYRGGDQQVTTDGPNQMHFSLIKGVTHEWDGINTQKDLTVDIQPNEYTFGITRMEDSEFMIPTEEVWYANNSSTSKVDFPSFTFFEESSKSNSPYYVPRGSQKDFYYKISEVDAGITKGNITNSDGYITIKLHVENDAGSYIYTVTHITYLGDNAKTVYKNHENVLMHASDFDLGTFFNKYDPTGALDIKVIDQDNNPVGGVTVKVTETNGNVKTYTTDSDGKVTKYSRGSNGEYSTIVGSYTIQVTAPDGYELATAGEKTVNVTENNVTSHVEQIVRIPKGALDIKVVDQDSNPVSGVTVKVTEPSGTEKTYTTNADGKVTEYSKSGSDYTAELGTYTISVTAPDGYELVTAGDKTVTVTADTVSSHEEQIRELPHKGALDIKVIDQDSNPVSGVEVKVTEPGGT
ncbi:MAG: carboxypeptidase regulatory-like domain-containing protein, partial [Lachnospiraceae bacterium]|nr:carboxypeptidase regulatory-like domain-containing protein [Lachnospiraceae bacterium]